MPKPILNASYILKKWQAEWRCYRETFQNQSCG